MIPGAPQLKALVRLRLFPRISRPEAPRGSGRKRKNEDLYLQTSCEPTLVITHEQKKLHHPPLLQITAT